MRCRTDRGRHLRGLAANSVCQNRPAGISMTAAGLRVRGHVSQNHPAGISTAAADLCVKVPVVLNRPVKLRTDAVIVRQLFWAQF